MGLILFPRGDSNDDDDIEKWQELFTGKWIHTSLWPLQTAVYNYKASKMLSNENLPFIHPSKKVWNQLLSAVNATIVHKAK